MNSLKLALFQLFLKDFQRANKFQIVCVRLILEKWELTGTPGHNGKLISDINLILA